MNFSYGSQSGRSTSFSSSTTAASGDATLETYTQTVDSSLSVGADDSAEDDGLAVVAGGDAIAIGEDTLATGTIQGEVDVTESVSTASASATFTSTSESSDGNTAYSSSTSYAESSSGDLVFRVNTTTSSTTQTTNQTEQFATSSSTSSSQVFAMEVNTSGSTGDETFEEQGSDLQSADDAVEYDETVEAMEIESCGSEGIDGNVAFLLVETEAYGEDTFVEVDASVLVVEDELSLVAASVVMAGA